MTPKTPSLPPLPLPGLGVFPGFTALRQESFVLKETFKHFTRSNTKVSFLAPNGKPGAPFLVIDEPKQKTKSLKDLIKGADRCISFRTVSGDVEVMRIVKGGREGLGAVRGGALYRGLDAAGAERWRLELKRHSFSGKHTEYILTVCPAPAQLLSLPVQNKVLGQDKGILFNGVPVATLSEPEAYAHLRREDHVHVAPGMDILVALGVCWIRYDKSVDDEKEAFDVVGEVVGAGAG